MLDKRIKFDERYDSEEYGTTTLYFIAPKEMLKKFIPTNDYPEAISMEYCKDASQATTCSLSMVSGRSGVTSSSIRSPNADTNRSPSPAVSMTKNPPVPPKNALPALCDFILYVTVLSQHRNAPVLSLYCVLPSTYRC